MRLARREFSLNELHGKAAKDRTELVSIASNGNEARYYVKPLTRPFSGITAPFEHRQKSVRRNRVKNLVIFSREDDKQTITPQP
mmetsp:Transcript_9130/g.40090  ORF Transcript_9130/g.40090 Transcript_9130/m.40090 type:complete len:84 (+) Transcript_9130:479-730(+)